MLKNKTALVTGSTSGIGLGIAKALARQGCNIMLNGFGDVQAAQDEVKALGTQVGYHGADMSKPADIEDMMNAAATQFGRVDILVNNAGLVSPGAFDRIVPADWERVLGVNLTGSYLCCRAVAPIMQRQRSGRIINISSISAQTGGVSGGAHYAAAKGGLLAMTKQLAMELAPTIRVNAIAPGPVLPPPDYNEKQLANVAGRTLLKRWGSAEDVAFAAKYLIEADYVTADVVRVDGGELYGLRLAGE